MGCTVSLMLAQQLEASGVGNHPARCRAHVTRVVKDTPLGKG